MQVIIEDPIPFPPDPPIHRSSIHQQEENTNNDHDADDLNINDNNQTTNTSSSSSNGNGSEINNKPPTPNQPTPNQPIQPIQASIAKIPETEEQQTNVNNSNSNPIAIPMSTTTNTSSSPSSNASNRDTMKTKPIHARKSKNKCNKYLDDTVTESNIIRRNVLNALISTDYRVKLYRLEDDGTWQDEGTGTIHFKLIDNDENNKQIDMKVVSDPNFEEDMISKIILHHRANQHILYDKQGQSIIQWLDTPTLSTSKGINIKLQIERAISFQHKPQCLELWRLIAFIKGFKKLSEFEAYNKKHRDYNNSTKFGGFTSDDEEDEDDDVEMIEIHKKENNNNKCNKNEEEEEEEEEMKQDRTPHIISNDESDGLLKTFLNDHDDDSNNDDSDNDNDIDINIDENEMDKTTETENKNLVKRKFKLKNKRKPKKKTKKKRKKQRKAIYFDEDNNENKIETVIETDQICDDSDDSENEERSTTIDSSSDEDDGGTEFLQKLTMRTQKKAKKNKLQIPIPTEHNLCEIYSRVKNAVENKDVAALNTLSNIEWREKLYDTFIQIEQKELYKINNRDKVIMDKQEFIPPPPPSITCNNKSIKSPISSKLVVMDIDKSEIPKLEKPRPPTLTPRLSTASLSTLPPSIEEDEDNERYHALEFIFMIVLECCRECQQIKQKKTKKKLKSRALAAKFEAITHQPLPYMLHQSIQQLLNGSFGHSTQRNTIPLMMIFLGKEFISKSIAMLEYDPIRRISQKTTEHISPISVSFKHRNYLKRAKPKQLEDIPLIDGDQLYEEIEYVYKLNYVRDCILLGKLDLEQQGFHILNHHIARYNALICETIAEDTSFLKKLFSKIKQSCSNNYGIIPFTNIDNIDNIDTPDRTPTLTPNTPPDINKNGDDDDDDDDDDENKEDKDDEEEEVVNMSMSRSISRTVSIDDDTTSSSSPSSSSNLLITAGSDGNGKVNGDEMMNGDDDDGDKTKEDKNKMETDDKNEDNDDEEEDDDDDDEYDREINRRRNNRKELFNAPDGILFRFLSEFLARTKTISDPQTKTGIFRELIANGLLDTLTVCVSAFHVLPTSEFSHIWLTLVECIHHIISSAPCGNGSHIRSFIVKQIKENEDEDDNDNVDDENEEDVHKEDENKSIKQKTLLQRLCGTYSPQYICDNDGILDQIYYLLTGILGLGDLIGLDGAQSLSYIGLGSDKDIRSKQLSIISEHFFNQCIPEFYRILNASYKYSSYNGDDDKASYEQIKTIQKYVINLLAACCEQDLFLPKLKYIEQQYDLMSCIHNLIYVPKDNNNNNNNNKRRSITNKDLSMCCIRFLRECMHLAQHDKFWSTRIRQYGLFKNILGIFDYNGINTYNMMNSTILSIFASIEEKKIAEIIMYLGEEKILEKYSKLICYTNKFDDLIELFEKTKHGIPISSQIEDGSSATLSNCSSLSPRMSPNGLSPGLMNNNGGGGWQNEPTKEEIHYFDDDDDVDDDEEDINYALDDGHDPRDPHKHDHKDQEEDDDDDDEEEEEEEEEDEEDIDMNHNGNSTPTKHRNGLSSTSMYKDSPRPPFGNKTIKELKLPNRNKEIAFDLLKNAKSNDLKREKKRFSLSIFGGTKQKNNDDESDTDKEKESSPFMNSILNATVSFDTNDNIRDIRRSTKRKFTEISNTDTDTLDINNNNNNNNTLFTSTSSYIANKFEIGQCLTSSDGIHETLSNYSPPKKKFKSMMNGINSKSHPNHLKSDNLNEINHVNESPDTFDTADNHNDDIDLNISDYNNMKNMNGDSNHNHHNGNQYGNHNGNHNGNHCINSSPNQHSSQSILLNGDDSNHCDNYKLSPKHNKHVHFQIDNASKQQQQQQQQQQQDIEMSHKLEDEFILHSHIETDHHLSEKNNLSPSQSAVCQT